jgi:hypothetical protein
MQTEKGLRGDKHTNKIITKLRYYIRQSAATKTIAAHFTAIYYKYTAAATQANLNAGLRQLRPPALYHLLLVADAPAQFWRPLRQVQAAFRVVLRFR